ncbi:hypothetical protein C8R46DRAFT_1209734 [Mycena filopes]|nr:hypothetical protein C8R46DRAFT_1209734 [Mycena filopes]
MSRPASPSDPGDNDNTSDSGIPPNAGSSFTVPETEFALDFLLADLKKYMSGNGFKDKTCTEISNALQKKFPHRPIRKKDTVGNRLRYVKGAFEDYEFVRGKSGVGWDDGEKMATAEADFVERFTEEHGSKYTKCFKKPCPYYDRLVKIFGGNKATGAHVLHLTKRKRKMKPTAASASTSAPSTSASTSATAKRGRAPLDIIDNDAIDVDSDPAPHEPLSPKPYDDELLPPPLKRRHTTIDIDSNDEDEKEQRPPKKVSVRDHDRSTSASSSSGGRRASRNAEAGTQIAQGLKLIGEGMSAPIITKADTSHVDAIVDVFIAEPTLLPADPEGEYYALFLDALSANEMRARVFVRTENRVQRIALLKRVLTEKGMDIPVEWV